MKSKKLIYKINFAFIGLFLILGCEKRDLDELQPLTFSSSGEVFLDGFTGDLEYAAFGNSDVTAFDVDQDVTFNGSEQSMRFAVPDEGSADGAFAGGAFTSSSGRDLSGYNALTFYLRASQPATIGELGFGNNLGENKFIVTLVNTPANTNWKKVIIPIPDASKLIGERGLFYYAAGAQEGNGFTFWIDEVQFENLGDLGDPVGLIFNGEDQVIAEAETGDNISVNGFQARALLPNGTNQTVTASVNYFTFSSSNPAIASVNSQGVISVVDAGTTTISGALGEQTATGSLELTSVGEPIVPTEVAPTPPDLDPADVISMYSNAFTNVPVGTWNARYLFSTVDEFFIEVEGDDVIRYRNLNFVGIEFFTPTVNAAAMTTLHMDIWTPDMVDDQSEFKILLADLGEDGAFGGENDSNFEITIPGSQLSSNNWISLDIPLSSFTGLNARTNLGQMVLSGSLPNLFMDNVYFYTEPVNPLTAAPEPTTPAEDVMSIFSDTYTDVENTNFNPNWGQSGFNTAGQTSIAGNNTLSYPNFNYQGIDIAGEGNSVDVSTFDFLHLDYFSKNATALNVFLISSDGVETAFSLNVPTDGWNSADIDLSAFAGVNLSEVIQFKFDGGTSSESIFLDNIYFWQSPALPTVPTIAAPVPTKAEADVLSIFSDSYTDVANTNFNPDWGQAGFATAGQIMVEGNNTLSYPNFNYQGIEIAGEGNGVDVSTYDFLHIDYYSVDATALNAFIISPGQNGPVETAFALNVPTTAGWNSVDIPLTDFAPVALDNVIQMKFDQGDATQNIFFDNIYFFRGDGGGGGDCPTPPAGEFIVDGDFEANAGCWELFEFQTGTSTMIVTNESNGTGTNSARIETAQAGNPGIKQSRFGVGVIQPNTNYTVEFDIRSDANDPLIDGAILNAFAFSEPAEGSSEAAVAHVLVGGDPNVPSTWTRRSITFTTAANVDGGVSHLDRADWWWCNYIRYRFHR